MIAIGSLGQLEKKRLIGLKLVKRRLIASFLLAIIAVGLWSGVLAFMVDCSYPFNRSPQATDSIPSGRLNLEWICGLLSAQIGLVSFFLSVCLFAHVGYEMLSDASETTDALKSS